MLKRQTGRCRPWPAMQSALVEQRSLAVAKAHWHMSAPEGRPRPTTPVEPRSVGTWRTGRMGRRRWTSCSPGSGQHSHFAAPVAAASAAVVASAAVTAAAAAAAGTAGTASAGRFVGPAMDAGPAALVAYSTDRMAAGTEQTEPATAVASMAAAIVPPAPGPVAAETHSCTAGTGSAPDRSTKQESASIVVSTWL